MGAGSWPAAPSNHAVLQPTVRFARRQTGLRLASR